MFIDQTMTSKVAVYMIKYLLLNTLEMQHRAIVIIILRISLYGDNISNFLNISELTNTKREIK